MTFKEILFWASEITQLTLVIAIPSAIMFAILTMHYSANFH